MRNISINLRCLSSSSIGGVQRYTHEIATRLPKDIKKIVVPRTLNGMIGHLWEQIILPIRLRGNLLWSPANTGPVLYKSQVATIHDIAPLDNPAWYDAKFNKWYGFMMPYLIAQAKHIITDSQFSANRMITVLHTNPDKISVVPLGVDTKFQTYEKNDELHKKIGLPKGKYVLSLFAISQRKNIENLFAAWSSIAPSLPQDISLVLAGDFLSVASHYKLPQLPSKTYLLGQVNDEYLPYLYSQALIFSFVSLYEGFGLPILEAMACGTPVITSNITAMPEVAGNAALLVNPYDIKSIADGIMQLVNNDELRKQLSVQGLARAKEFTWDKTANLIKSILEQAANTL